MGTFSNPPKFSQPNPAGGPHAQSASIGPSDPQDWTQFYKWLSSLVSQTNQQAGKISGLQTSVDALEKVVQPNTPFPVFQISDTHANRVNYPAGNFVGARYYETDRKATYLSIYTGGNYVWVWVSGTMMSTSATLADVPGDLGANDAGFQFYNKHFLRLWIWNATDLQFHYADGLGAGSQVCTSGAAPSGGLWHACDGSIVSTGEDNATIGARTASPLGSGAQGDPFITGGAGGPYTNATAPTWDPAAVTDSAVTGIAYTSTTFQVFGAGTNAIEPPLTDPGHDHALSNANAKLNPPTVANGGLPPTVSTKWWMRL
jgi:hypothetical protein